MRDTVLNAASRLFMEFGYEPVSLNQIAAAAGVTKASVYYYFASKANLFTVSLTEMMKRICISTTQIMEREISLRERLETIATVKLASTHVEFESMMREALPSLSAEQQEDIRRAEHSIHEVLADCFRKAIAKGEIEGSHSPMLLSHAFTALMLLGNRESDLAEEASGESAPLAKRLVDLFWQGVGPRS